MHFETQGRDAYVDGVPDRPPEPESTYAGACWLAGWWSQKADDWVPEGEIAEAEENAGHFWRVADARLAEIEANLPDPEEAARLIGIPLADWPGNCHAVSVALVEAGAVPGKAVFGHYHGEVDPESRFAGRPLVQHGWIAHPEGCVVDPTRWVFDCAAPKLHVAGNRDGTYDRGGQAFRVATSAASPPEDDGSSRTHLGVTGEAERWLSMLFGDPVEVTPRQAHWLATQPPAALGEMAADVHDALREAGFKALIPIDFWEMSREQVRDAGVAPGHSM